MALQGVYEIFNEKWCNQTVWIYSDPHFGDKDLAAGISDRPSAATQVKLINSKVGSQDTLIILGDVGDPEYVKQLRGYKILITGNHDAGVSNYQRDCNMIEFDKDLYSKEEALAEMKKHYPGCRFTIGEGHQLHKPFSFWLIAYDNNLFDEIYAGPLMIGEKLILSHEPIENITWAMNIHGHDHSKNSKNDSNHFNVCSDVINYTPVNLNQWLKQGHLSKIETIHRRTIDAATERKQRRLKK